MVAIDPVALLRKPLPASANNIDIASAQELGHMLQEKREAAASELGVQQMVIRRAFLDTSAGLNLTQPLALKVARDKENAGRAKGASRRWKAEEANAEKANSVRVRREREHIQLVKAQTATPATRSCRVTSSGHSLCDAPLLGGTVQSPASVLRTPRRPRRNHQILWNPGL
jgi:hypothetical protein